MADTPVTDVTTTAPAVPALTKGYRTSEFWLGFAALMLTALFSSGIVGGGSNTERALSLLAAALTSMGYSVSRGMAKKTA